MSARVNVRCPACGWTGQHASTPAGDLVSDAEATRIADELLGPPVDSHVSRAYGCDGRDAKVT